MIDLPIDKYLDEIRLALNQHGSVIVAAPPGTGKTTRVAPFLLTGNPRQQTVLVQPRRIAARAAAARIASELGTAVGQRIGYQVRFDRRTSADTELVCMTPGILLRKLQHDPLLEDVGQVLLDEFHERSVEYDLLLGMLRRVQTEVRHELKIVVMSATLDSDSLTTYLNGASTIRVTAETFPVSIRHTPFRAAIRGQPRGMGLPRQIVESTAAVTLEAMQQQTGDCLVFLPGVGEIQQVAELVESTARKNDWRLFTLYGDMRPEDQDRVLQPMDHRKLILSTNVAETSLTIDGVRLVIDSGYARVQRFDPAAGLDMLQLEPISIASAQQRTGRAGRTAPGVCYRLWDKVTERARAEYLEPEINRVDLAGPVLQLLCWGEHDLAGFLWLTRPHADSLQQALDLLQWLSATQDGKPTDLGRKMLKLPVHPRLARLLVTGHEMSIPHASALAATILSEREILVRPDPFRADRKDYRPPMRPTEWNWDCDVGARVAVLKRFAADGRIESAIGPLHPGAARNAMQVANQLLRILEDELGPVEEQAVGDKLSLALLSGFPDRLCKRRGAGQPRGVMVGGRGVQLHPNSGVKDAELFLGIHVDGRGSEATVRLASAVEQTLLPGNLLTEKIHRFYNPTTTAVVTRRQICWSDLVLSETPIPTPTDPETACMLAPEVARVWHRILPAKDKAFHSWLDRVAWLGHAMPELHLPALSGDGLSNAIEPYLVGCRSLADAQALSWKSLLQSMLNSHQRRQLERHAPEGYQFPSGHRVLLQYEIGKAPILAGRIQEFFGLTDAPKLAGGRVRLVLHLLAPNNRCEQITDDLASFWKNTYPQVRKDLRGRYPKHKWPENPLSGIE